jgi:glycosyltransferase involved in cell wall biosynthesis
MSAPEIAVILPCFNEAAAIAEVVADFRRALPAARICVFDNNSTDNTIALAKSAGAEVMRVRAQGKGNVLRHAFALVDAELYVVADGDGTYDAAQAPALVELLETDGLDMVVGVRRDIEQDAFRSGHVFGNRLFNVMIGALFGHRTRDVFSGYRVLSRPFVRSFPALATGFEIETEMSLHAFCLQLPVAEVETNYRARPEGSASKLRTLQDGWRILFYILRLVKYMRPFLLGSCLAAFACIVSLLLGIPIVIEFIGTGAVPRLPTAVAAASIMLIAVIAFVTGVILDSVSYAQREQKRLAYLGVARRRRS